MLEPPCNTQLAPFELWKVRQTVDGLLSSVAPASAIRSLMAKAGAPGAEPFERYAGTVLRDAGGERLSELPPTGTVLLSPPAEGRLARLTCTAALDERQSALLVDIENALNRLCCVADALEDSGGGRPEGPTGVAISRMGGGFLSDRAGYHSANVKLPPIGRAEQPGAGYFNEIDWRVLDHIATTAHPVFQSSVLPNMHQAFMGAYGPDGSDWDVRTRLAGILETLELPLRLECRFDVDTHAQAVSIAFTVPPTGAFPRRAFDAQARAFVDVSDRVDDVRIAYAMRLSCLLAAAAFGSGRKIGRTFVTGVREADSACVFTCSFSRKRYVYETLTAIDAGELANPAIRFDTAAIARVMAPDSLEYVRFDGDSRIDGPRDGMADRRVEAHLDERPLPDGLRALFHARRICDIDTYHYHGPGAQAVNAARDDAGESVVAAIAHLEHVAAELERDTVPPDDDADARPLYCSKPLARAVVSLLDDEFAVGSQAEAFLHGDAADAPAPDGRIRYFRAPDALYHAHMGLSDLYERLGDIPGSEAHADRCIALAPTSAAAYFRKADVLASQRRYPEAANVLIAGLRVAVSPRDCSLLYYHLALIMWNTGRKREAAAVHVYAASLSGEFAEKSRKVVMNLRKHDDSPVIVYASPIAAAREMERARIPVAPSDAARMLVVKAAVGLSCAGAPLACAPYAAAVASYFPGDAVIAATCRSIRFGTALANGSASEGETRPT